MEIKNTNKLDHLINELVKEYGITKIIRSVISACDSSADFSHLCNEKQTEDYWRNAAVCIFDCIKKIGDMPEKSRKFKK